MSSDFGYRTRKGEDHPNHKLAGHDRRYIHERREEGATYAQIAQEMGVSIATVRRVDQGLSYTQDEG